MSRRRSLSEEERALWTGVARSIKPLRARRLFAESPGPNQSAELSAEPLSGGSPRAAKPPAKTKKSAPARARVPAAGERQPEKRTPPPAPLGRRLRQRVARGREPIEARLDLHGFTQAQAHAELLRFLRRAQTDGVRTALVVTGKGASKAGELHERGVLKRQVPLWLSLPEFRSLVVGYDDAHVGHGGTGALYVRLRRSQRAES
jgi:DNA-nicking Smr family endonuclease